METLITLLPFTKDAGPVVAWVVLFIGALYALWKIFGGWFTMAQQSAAGTNDAMLKLIERLTGEIDRLGRAEAKIMERLAECEQRHLARDSEVEKLQFQVAALNVKLFSVGLGKDPA